MVSRLEPDPDLSDFFTVLDRVLKDIGKNFDYKGVGIDRSSTIVYENPNRAGIDLLAGLPYEPREFLPYRRFAANVLENLGIGKNPPDLFGCPVFDFEKVEKFLVEHHRAQQLVVPHDGGHLVQYIMTRDTPHNLQFLFGTIERFFEPGNRGSGGVRQFAMTP
jgi:hypothetical protein